MKNPAVLFYTSDFITGTMFMSNEEVGAYIRCLCMQHQKGHLSNDEMLQICGDKLLEKVSSKFKKDSKGFYYNKRMDEEIEKRENYSKSRANNRKSKKTYEKDMKKISKTYEEHMENENENINENENNKRFTKPTLEDIQEYCKSRNNNIDPYKFYEYYETNNWKDKDNKQIKNWKQKIITWEGRNKNKTEDAIIPNWFNKDIKKQEISKEEQEELTKLLEEF